MYISTSIDSENLPNPSTSNADMYVESMHTYGILSSVRIG